MPVNVWPGSRESVHSPYRGYRLPETWLISCLHMLKNEQPVSKISFHRSRDQMDRKRPTPRPRHCGRFHPIPWPWFETWGRSYDTYFVPPNWDDLPTYGCPGKTARNIYLFSYRKEEDNGISKYKAYAGIYCVWKPLHYAAPLGVSLLLIQHLIP